MFLYLFGLVRLCGITIIGESVKNRSVLGRQDLITMLTYSNKNKHMSL
jgi:hypothetical protein